MKKKLINFMPIPNRFLDITENRDITNIMGDLNAKIGKSRVEDIIEDFGLGRRNGRLTEFCQKDEVAITKHLLQPA